MKLLNVSVEGVGRFGTTARLEGLGAGVNILSAHNEAGKSTMFRAIRTCLFERHNTTRDEVKKLATEGLSLPVKMTIGFEHDGQHFELTKSFLRGPAAKLTRDGTEIARNRDADEMLWEILGITPDNKIDQGAYGVLWVEQGQSFYVPQPSEAAASVLNNVIQQEVGTLVGGERARQLLKDAKDELGKLLTESGKAKTKGPLDAAQRQLESVEQQRLEAEQRLSELDANLEALAGKRAEWARLSDPAETQRLAADLQEAEKALKVAAESVQSLQRFETDERQAFQLHSAQQDVLDSLRVRALSIDENRTRFKQLSIDTDSKDEAIAAARAALDLVNAGKARIDHDTDQSDAEVQRLQRLEALSQKARTRETQQSRLALLQSLDARLMSNDAALKSITVDDAALKSLDAIERDIKSISTRMESQAARLTIAHKSGAQVAVNGEAAPSHLSRAITEPLTITIGDDVAISISPPASSLATVEAEQREQQTKLLALFARHGVSTTAELQQVRAERIVLEEEARQLKAERTALGLKEPTAATEIMRLSIEIRQIDSEVQRVLSETGSASLPSDADIDRQRQALQQSRSELRAARAQAESLIAGHTGTINRNAEARAALTGQIKELDARIAADLARLPDIQRLQLLGDAERELEQRASIHRARAALLAEKRQTVPSTEDLDRLRLRAERLRAARSNHQAKLDALRVDIAKLEGQVQTAGGDGLGERVAELQAESAIAQVEVRHQSERAEVLQLLRTVVETAYEKRREQLNAPLLRHLKPFLQDVFPQAEIALGDGFSVEGLKRTGPGSELFGRLSHGTQEQVAVLVRLAMGAMIAEKGHDVPIILDDALVFSDDARIEQMFDAINRAGRNQQVIVLTCRTRSFASLGGNQLRIT